MVHFLAGIALGAVAVVAYKNNDKVKEKIQEGASTIKGLACEGYEKGKDKIAEVKQYIDENKKSTKKSTKNA